MPEPAKQAGGDIAEGIMAQDRAAIIGSSLALISEQLIGLI